MCVCHRSYFLQYSTIQWKNPIGFCRGSPCYANFPVGLQKYVITAPLYGSVVFISLLMQKCQSPQLTLVDFHDIVL